MVARIEVHYSDRDGHGVINRFPGDNAELSVVSLARQEVLRQRLRQRAERCASFWALVYPESRVHVEETEL